MENAFACPIATVLSHFGVDEQNGLSDKQVEELRNKYGRNGTQTPSMPFFCATSSHARRSASIASCQQSPTLSFWLGDAPPLNLHETTSI